MAGHVATIIQQQLQETYQAKTAIALQAKSTEPDALQAEQSTLQEAQAQQGQRDE